MLNYGAEPGPAGPGRSRRPDRQHRLQHHQQRFACSQQSVLSAIERFVKAVDGMDAAVLVPSRLRDMEVQAPQHLRKQGSSRTPPPGLHQHQDLHSFYAMLKDVRSELLWGPSAPASLFPGAMSPSLMSSMSSGMSSPRAPAGSVRGGGTTTPLMSMTSGGAPMTMSAPMTMMAMMGGVTPSQTRQSSDDGLGSSTGCSDTDSEFESIVSDSVIMEQTSHLATAFRHHLHGLHAILHQLADSADYLADRYQEEIDSA